MKTPLFVIVCIACLSFPGGVCSQEVQVPLDAEGELEIIGKELEQEIRIFPDYVGFKEARLFQVSGDSFALEIYYRREGRLFKQRLLLPPAKIDSLRREISAKIQMLHPPSLQDRSGRTRFLIRTFLLSYGFYSWAIPFTFDMEGKAAQITALLTGSGGFLVPFSVTGKTPVSQAAAALSGHGGTTGIAHGILLSELLFGEGNSLRKGLAMGLTGSMSGLVGGFALAQKSHLTAGTAELVGWGGNYGLVMGLGTAHLANILDEDYQDEGYRRQVALAALLGSGMGYWGGYALARQHSYSSGDAEVQVTTTLLGAYLATSLLNLTGSENSKAYTGAAMAGSMIGLGMGHSLLRDQEFSTGESRMMMLGAVGGMLFGGATALLIGGDSQQVSLSLTSLGALGGFWFTYRSFAEGARVEERSVSWNIGLAPQGLPPFAAWSTIPRSRSFRPRTGPALTCSYRFY